MVKFLQKINKNCALTKKFSMRFFLFNLFFIFSFTNATCFGFDYREWWENWYNNGGTSGIGNIGLVKEFKVGVINDFIDKHVINSVVEFGCGDGVILQLAKYKNYLGLDVSKAAITMCATKFKDDPSKSFMLYDPQYFVNNKIIKKLDLVVCLDVLYHVIDEADYIKLLDDIFSFSSKYVIFYTTLFDKKNPHYNPEIKNRNVLEYLKKYKNYDMVIVKQKYKKLSGADFIFLTKKSET